MTRRHLRRLGREAGHASLILGALLVLLLAALICTAPSPEPVRSRPHPIPVASAPPLPITTMLPPSAPTLAGGGK